MRHPDLLSRTTSRLLIVDMQTRFMPVIHDAVCVTGNCRRLIKGAHLLQVPVSATEQYPQGLGETIPELAELLPDRRQKMQFSSRPVLEWGLAAEQADDRFQVIVAGIEAHVCILQTVFDLLSDGYSLYVPADAVTSRRARDADRALNRMASAGASIVTTESVLFEWCEVSGTPEFKAISQLVKES